MNRRTRFLNHLPRLPRNSTTALAAATLAALAATLPPVPLHGQATPDQVGAPSAPAVLAGSRAPANQNQNNVNATTSGNYHSSTGERQSDKIWEPEKDSFDFENGSFQWKGRTFNLGNSALIRARLERYFAAPAAAGNLREYERLLKEIEDLLSPNKVTRANYVKNVTTAWDLLYKAGDYDADGGNSRIIAGLVEKTTRMRRELQSLQMERNSQHAEKNTRLRNSTEFETHRERKKDDALGASGFKGSGKNKIQMRAPEEGTAESARRKELLLESRQELARTDGRMSNIGLRAQLEFQSQIVLFLAERRFRHAIIAAHFYRQLFQGGAQNLQVGQKQVKEMFPVSDFVPTIDAVEMLAREAIKDVDTGMKAVNALYDSGARWGAFERIRETFLLGEHEPCVQFFDPEKKRTMKTIWSNARDLQRMGDERDLDGCEKAIKEISAVASDFPGTPIRSKINNARQASDLELLSAESAALANDTAGAKAGLERATRIWPLNPGIRNFMTKIRERADQLSRLVPEFDDLHKRAKLREIYERKNEFGLALAQHKERLAKLETIINNLGKIDFLIVAAESMAKDGKPYSAWDILENARAFGASDPKLAQALAELTPRAAQYVAVLRAAADAEKNGEYAAALTAYLAAADLNPPSELCRNNIKRLSTLLLEQIPVAAN